ncbi:MAG TPA: tetratricopeptide repeat protein [Candidatus Gastranaerophilales bacterium]|nr:tetratricopeptide repeat protein [Candidatus Gastranaerophilales bacterium]
MNKLKRALKNIFIFFLFLFIALLVFIFSESIFKYIIHGKSFYQVYLGDKEYKQGNFAEAIEHYNKAVKLYPNHVKARYNLANIYVNFEDYESAVREYEMALKYNPEYLNARLSLGIILSEELLEFDRAILEYENVIKTKTRLINIPFIYDNREQIIIAKAIAYYNMGLAYRDKSMLFTEDSIKYRSLLLQAIDCYENSLTLNSKNFSAQYNLAIAKHLLGLYTEALTGYCKALVISPMEYEAHYNLAILLREKRLYLESFEAFKNAGSLMDYSGDTYRAAFIYGLLNEVSQLAISEYGYRPKDALEKLKKDAENTHLKDDFMTMDELEKALIKNIKTKSICKNYLKNF